MVLLVLSANAKDYNNALKSALRSSGDLLILKKNTQRDRLQGEIDYRLDNPNIELELSYFKSNNYTFGRRVGITQSLMLPSVKNDKKLLTQMSINLSKSRYKLQKSKFIYRFNIYYLNYKERLWRLKVKQEAINISKKILDIANKRYTQGSIAQSELLQAKIDYSDIVTQKEQLKLDVIYRKNRLLEFAKLSHRHKIDRRHIFKIKRVLTSKNAMLMVSKAKFKIAKAKLKVANHKIKKISLFTEVEREAGSRNDIFRVGINLPLPIFNTSSQEKQLAKLEMANQKIKIQNIKRLQKIKLKSLKKERVAIKRLIRLLNSQLANMPKLLKLYQEGYTLAKTNLLRLQESKKRVLDTKTEIIQNKIALEKNAIDQNYIRGVYND